MKITIPGPLPDPAKLRASTSKEDPRSTEQLSRRVTHAHPLKRERVVQLKFAICAADAISRYNYSALVSADIKAEARANQQTSRFGDPRAAPRTAVIKCRLRCVRARGKSLQRSLRRSSLLDDESFNIIPNFISI
ncbi:hypothetical protein TSAR_003856 [Trichomalopsis sarcophagae]|uniref:Uncharacterized protein n=1 Tax=Trichomalopsis sarcophagae TaxID=543379 RepID=A0A232F141_9HYME|nr:hypothetical protein TSAR_003856 [Trichomalopsis sarcophagae]